MNLREKARCDIGVGGEKRGEEGRRGEKRGEEGREEEARLESPIGNDHF